MARDKKSMIGFDPLAWLDEEAPSDVEEKPVSEKPENAVLKSEVAVAEAEIVKETLAPETEDKKMITVLGHVIDETIIVKGYELIKNDLKDAVGDFYSELFEKFPDIKPLFENVSTEEQQVKLSSAVDLLAESLHDNDALEDALSQLGKRHQTYNVLPEHYPVVVELLLASFKNKIGRRWTKAINAEWMALLSVVTEFMCAAYEVASADEPVDTKDETEMNTKEVHGSHHSVLQLNSVQDISKSQMLKNDMLALINDNDGIDIEASSVEKIDGSALQLLCGLFIYAKENSLDIHWVEPSEALLNSVKTLGLTKIFELE